jgi:membrane protease YdiL (CAAX protease family)
MLPLSKLIVHIITSIVLVAITYLVTYQLMLGGQNDSWGFSFVFSVAISTVIIIVGLIAEAVIIRKNLLKKSERKFNYFLVVLLIILWLFVFGAVG